jgi:hypothetical protein
LTPIVVQYDNLAIKLGDIVLDCATIYNELLITFDSYNLFILFPLSMSSSTLNSFVIFFL